MKALVLGSRVCQVGEEFPVAEPLQWVECPDYVTSDYEYVNGVFSIPSPIVIVKTNSELLAETDTWMSRISEDTVVALINKGVAQKTDYASIVIDRINYRRGLRGQAPI